MDKPKLLLTDEEWGGADAKRAWFRGLSFGERIARLELSQQWQRDHEPWVFETGLYDVPGKVRVLRLTDAAPSCSGASG